MKAFGKAQFKALLDVPQYDEQLVDGKTQENKVKYLVILCLSMGACASAPKIIQGPLEVIEPPAVEKPLPRKRSISLKCEDCDFSTSNPTHQPNRLDEWMEIGNSLHKLRQQGINVKQGSYSDYFLDN